MLLTNQQDTSAEQVVDRLLARYADSDDDVALIVLRIPPKPAPTGSFPSCTFELRR